MAGELLRDYNGVNYPTHSLGPIAQWLGINQRGDSFDYMTTFVSEPLSQSDYFSELFGKDHPGEEPLIWLDSRSTERSYNENASWTPLSEFAEEFEHPWWKESGDKAEKASNFGDYFVMKKFASAIQEGRSPEMDVYDSVAISSVFPLSRQSVENQGKPVSFPDFSRNKFVN